MSSLFFLFSTCSLEGFDSTPRILEFDSKFIELSSSLSGLLSSSIIIPDSSYSQS